MILSNKQRLYFVENRISRAELKVIEKLIVHGNQQAIADSLFVSRKCVKFHFTNIYKKLKLTKTKREGLLKLIKILELESIDSSTDRGLNEQ